MTPALLRSEALLGSSAAWCRLPTRQHTPHRRRYFLHTWPHLCFMAFDGERCFGTVVAKMEVHREALMRGYIAMLVVEKQYRYLGVGAYCAGLGVPMYGSQPAPASCGRLVWGREGRWIALRPLDGRG